MPVKPSKSYRFRRSALPPGKPRQDVRFTEAMTDDLVAICLREMCPPAKAVARALRAYARRPTVERN